MPLPNEPSAGSSAGDPRRQTGHWLDGAVDILESEHSRLDDLAAQFGLKPDRAFVGQDMAGAEFVGTPDRPMDLRGWNLSCCNLTGATFEHVIVDGTTLLEGTVLDDITGSASVEILALRKARIRPPAPARRSGPKPAR